VHTGSLAAVTSAILLAGVTIDRAATSTTTDDAASQTPDGTHRTPAGASRSATRTDTPDQPDAAAAPDADDARRLAREAVSRASALIATEARTTPALHDEVVAASTVLVELIRRSESTDGPTLVSLAVEPDSHEAYADAAPEPEPANELAEAVDLVLQGVADDLGLEAVDEDATAKIVSHALERVAADLEAILADAPLAVVEVEPAPATPAQILAQQIAEGQADAERLAPMAELTRGHENGRLPDSVLTSLSWAPNQRLRPDAAAQLERLNVAFRAQFGHDLAITSSYRSFSGQVRARQNHGHMAATPGTSTHGWGLAVDLGSGVQQFGTATHRWMRANAPAFGWEHPAWARQGGILPEPWHWEFEGVPTL
jgi:LAS superfamily LD-carboxypeptidase LdcB